MNSQEMALYEAAKAELDKLYHDVEAVRAEFRELIAAMAAQLLAEEAS